MRANTGDIFVCLKSNSRYGTVKGKRYLYDRGSLKTFSTRNVTLLNNGDAILDQPKAFELAVTCPFCLQQIFPTHDGVKCASEWDARVKNYCHYCSADLVNGKCPNCE